MIPKYTVPPLNRHIRLAPVTRPRIPGPARHTYHMRCAPRLPALASMMVIGGLVVFMLAIMGLAINMTGFLDRVYMDLALTLPRFDYTIQDGAESGNETFAAYVQMRYAAGGVMGVALLWAGLARALEGSGTIPQGASNRVISRSILFVILFLAFPPIWDGGAHIMESVSLWVLNPHYSFDPDSPCPKEWSDTDIIQRYEESPYRRGPADTNPQMVCDPQLKIRYIFGQMMGTTELQTTKSAYMDPEDPFGALTLDVQNFAESVLVNTFLGLTKALVTINVLLLAFVIGIMADLLIGMVIAALPVFLMMTLIPRADHIANRFLDALPALFMLPLLSAVVVSVGAGFIAQIGECADTCPDHTLTYAWISSLGVVFFAVTLPVLLVPLLGHITQVASRTITGAIQTAGTVAGTGVAGAVQGVRSGLAQPGGVHDLSSLARAAGAGSLGGFLGSLSGASRTGTKFSGMEPTIPVGPATSAAGSYAAGGAPGIIDRITGAGAVSEVESYVGRMRDENDAMERLRRAGVEGLPTYDPGADIRAHAAAMEKIRRAAGDAHKKAWDAYEAQPSIQMLAHTMGMEGLAARIKSETGSRYDAGQLERALRSSGV